MTTTNNDKHSSTVSTESGESHPSYRVIFRHVNCRKRSQSEKSSGFTPSCVSTVDWRPTQADSGASDSSPDTVDSEAIEADCCGTDNVNSEEVAILRGIDLVGDLERVTRRLCTEKSDQILETVVLRERIVWENGPPKSSSGMFHNSAVTPNHLVLMRQRKCNDHIEADFGTHYDDEEFRRESMLRALTKLSQKASSHCNR